jgi:malate dehydrogenase (oxaloacetate-decarboxylating)
MDIAPSASHSLTLRVDLPDKPGALARLLTAIGDSGGMMGAVDLIDSRPGMTTRELTVNARDEAHASEIVEAVRRQPGIWVLNVSDRTFAFHLKGKIEVRSKLPLRNRDDLSMAYTPGVARVSRAIADDPNRSFSFTIRANMIAVVSDGSAVLGLGDIGPEAALPVMEGKAQLFKAFAGVDAFPLCLGTHDPDEIVATVEALAPTFGGINLEDISAPRCFEIEGRLKASLDIPVFHDDQHGTAVVVLAALLNSLKIVGKSVEDLNVVVSGLGAAGVACTKMLMAAGVERFIGLDSQGIVHRGRDDLNEAKTWFAEHTNADGVGGGLADAMAGADLFLGLSQPGLLSPDLLDLMARDPIVFAMANPIPEIMPEFAAGKVRVMATGRSDYPNQINNVLCFPGIFRGALDCRAREINEEMKLAAANAIAEVVGESDLSAVYVIPSVFDERVVPAVATAVAEAAQATGVARLPDGVRPPDSPRQTMS